MWTNTSSITHYLNVQFCEGKYGGGFAPLDGPSDAVYLPERFNAFSGLFITWCGIHMLLFNQHDDLTLKIVAANFCLNGGASFLYHWTGYDSALTIDGYLMMNAVWITTGFVLEELSSHMVDGPGATWQLCHKRRIVRRLLRTVYWIVVTSVPALFLLALEKPWRDYVGNISPWFIGAFITPLLVMLAVNLILMLYGVEDVNFQHYPSPLLGERTFSSARRRFFWGLCLVLLGVGAWLLTEGLCDHYGVFRLFPGHAIFHILVALGLLNCLLYPATLRADTYGSYTRFLADARQLQPHPEYSCTVRGLHAMLRRLLLCYLFVFPAYSFVRSHMWLPSSSGNDVPRTPGSADTRKRTTPKSLPSGRPSQYGLTSPNPQQLEDLVNCAVEREMTKRLNGTPQMHSQRLPPPDEVQQSV